MLECDLGFTGTRHGMTGEQRVQFRRLLRQFYGVLHVGDAIGSDLEASQVADEIGGFFFHIHPPCMSKFRGYFIPRQSEYRIFEEKDYGDRDLDIVTESDVMIGTPHGYSEVRRGSGTWLTIRMARAEQKPLAIIYPNGKIEYERWHSLLPRLKSTANV